MELRHFRSFAVLAEELHFGRAARTLNIVQPALSQQLQALERELGVMLLLRDKRNVALTEAGHAFLVEARRTLASAESARLAAVNAAHGKTGRLRIGYVDLAMWHSLPAILRSYRKAFPQVQLSLSEMHREPLREALMRGALDVALFSLREGDVDLEGQRLTDDVLSVALPSGHPLAKRRKVPLTALAKEPWVLFPRELKTLYQELVVTACARAGFTPGVVQEASQLHSLAALVRAGLGVSLVPSAMSRTERSGIVYRPLAGTELRLPLHVVWRANDAANATQIQQFAKLCR